MLDLGFGRAQVAFSWAAPSYLPSTGLDF